MATKSLHVLSVVYNSPYTPQNQHGPSRWTYLWHNTKTWCFVYRCTSSYWVI